MMGLVLGMRQKLVGKGMSSEVLVVWLGQTSKSVDMLIIPDVASNDQPMTKIIRGSNNWKLSLNSMGIGF